MSVRPAKLVPVTFNDMEGWGEDNLAEAFNAFRVSAKQMQRDAFPTKSLGVSGTRLREVALLALDMGEVGESRVRAFFEENFVPHQVVSDQRGFLTGYYEPEVEAAQKPDAIYRYPLYRRPDELVDLRDHNRPQHMDASYRFGRKTDQGIGCFFDRAAIDSGALDGRGLEIAWLADRVDQFFIHVQGSARLRFSDGKTMRVAYAAKSGHPYTSLGKLLCERLNVSPEDMTADRLADWMRNNPDKLDEFLSNNRSYIFFRETDDRTGAEGPIGAAGCPLTAGRSLAVDRTIHTFGTPVWVSSRQSFVNSDDPLKRLMIAQDTGSAIVNPARGDIFIGSGAEARLLAGKVRHEIDMTVFLPRENQ